MCFTSSKIAQPRVAVLRLKTLKRRRHFMQSPVNARVNRIRLERSL